MNARVLIAGLLLLGGSPSPAAADSGDKPRVEQLSTDVTDGRLVVSYSLAGVFSDELVEQIASGIPLRLRHHAEVVIRRRLWVDRIVARARIETTARYDSLTRRYELVRRVEGSRRAIVPEPPEERLWTSSAEEMREWMTRLDRFPAFDLDRLEPGVKLRVRVESVLGRRWYLLVPVKRTVTEEQVVER